MGYGGIFKKVFRVAATIIGGIACGAPCAAIGSAVATGATGGSFKEALIAGATAYIGAKITQGISTCITESATSQAASQSLLTGAGQAIPGTSLIVDSVTGATLFSGQAAVAGIDAAFDAAANAGIQVGVSTAAEAAQLTSSIIGDTATSLVDPNTAVNQGITSAKEGASKFIDTTFGTVGGVNRTAFDFIKNSGESLLGKGGLGLDLTPLSLNNAGDLIAAGAGGLTELTLNQALNADLPGLDDVLGQKFNSQQIQSLREAARNQLSQQKFDQLISEQANPFLREGQTPEQIASAEEEFNKVIASGIERENIGLGPDVTQQQFDASFEAPNFGQSILDDELGLRRSSFGSELDKTFTGDAFSGIDDDIINSIIEERKAPALQQVSKTQARGNLNTTGGQTANRFLEGQVGQAGEKIRTAGSGVLSGNQAGVDAIRDTAREGISNYQLGDDLFDPSPFTEQRQGFIDERQGTLRDDLSTAVGSDPLFDVGGAINAGGRSGGLVSGGTGASPSFLDSIAARERGTLSGTTSKRGLGSRGSGTF